MQVNIKKSKMLIQPARGQKSRPMNIDINGQLLEDVERFTYLGSIFSKTSTYEKDAENSAHYAVGRLSKCVFFNHVLTIWTKIMIYHWPVYSTLVKLGCCISITSSASNSSYNRSHGCFSTYNEKIVLPTTRFFATPHYIISKSLFFAIVSAGQVRLAHGALASPEYHAL